MRRRRASCLLRSTALSVVVLAAGCGLGQGPETPTGQGTARPALTGSPATPQDIDPQPATTSQLLSREEAGDFYLELVEPVNAAVLDMDAVGERYNDDDASFEDLQAAFETAADAHLEFFRGLEAAAWPADVTDLVQQISANSKTVGAYLRAFADAPTEDEGFAISAPFDDVAPAQELRRVLGLDDIPEGG